jgi:hypothetical protein
MTPAAQTPRPLPPGEPLTDRWPRLTAAEKRLWLTAIEREARGVRAAADHARMRTTRGIDTTPMAERERAWRRTGDDPDAAQHQADLMRAITGYRVGVLDRTSTKRTTER